MLLLRLSALPVLCVLLLSCGGAAPGGGATSGMQSTKVEQGNGVLLRKSSRYEPYPDTTVVLLDSAGRIRVNNVVFQGTDFDRLIVNQWESEHAADSALPLALRLEFQQAASAGRLDGIRAVVARAQDTVRTFVMKKEGLDSATAVRKYPVLVRPLSVP